MNEERKLTGLIRYLGPVFWSLALASLALSQGPLSAGSELFAQHGSVMLLIEPQSGAIVDANPAAALFYGYTVDELRRMRIQQINTLTADEILQERLRAAKERNNFFIFHHRLASGELRTVEVYSSPVQIDQQRFLLSIIHDATRREDFQVQLAKDELRLRHAEHVADFGHWIYDLDQEMYTLSAGAEKIFGLEGERWTDDVLHSLLLPEYRRMLKEARRLLVEQGQSYDIQVRAKRVSDGEIIDLHSHASYDAEKRQIFGIILDVTEYAQVMRDLEIQSSVFARWMTLAVFVQFAVIVLLVLVVRKLRSAKRLVSEREATLREHSEMIQLLLDSTAEAIYGIDLQGRCTFCNAASVRLLGYETQAELIGRNMHELMHHTHADGTPFPVADCAIYQAFMKHEKIHVDSEVLWRADGTSFAAEYWSYPIFREGKVIGSVVTFLDITSRKQAEEALREKSAELERFTYAVSHDLKSPLVTIKAFLGFLKEDMVAADAERIDKDMTFLHTAVDKMERLLEELLEMARIGRVVNLPVAVSMTELVDEALTAVAGRIAERRVEVRVTAETVQFFGDRPRLVEIWQNLIDNAVKYMGEQTTPCIDIGSESGPEGTVFYVRDNGMGIEPGFHGKVFGLFEKLDQCSEGSGLGLALVKRIVE
ncbi:MAG: PAS domain S-box protein, partial [Desulfuromonadales bacterium]|nr:PAS domain S-box protein [Desulfuromonadales bacterium]